MNRIYIIMLFICASLNVIAQDNYLEKYPVEILEITSANFEWNQFDKDDAECKFRKNALVLECKDKKSHAVTTTELDFDVTNVDYILIYQFDATDLDDDKPFGIIYDYKNGNNFQTLCFGKKNFQILSYETGEKNIIKEGLYKIENKKNVMVTVLKRGKRLDFYLGSQNLPLTTIRNHEMKNSNIGFYVEGKTKMKLTGIGYRLIIENEEEDKD